MNTLNILSGPSRDRMIQSLADAYRSAVTEVSFTIENTDGTTSTYVGRITKLEHEDGSGNNFNFGGHFKGHGYVKGWYDSHKRKGFIIV